MKEEAVTEINGLMSDADSHYWHPVPEPDGRRRAFRGSRRWAGQAAGTAVCGVEVALARPSEMDCVYKPTCGRCWEALIDQQRSRSTVQ